MSDEDKSKETTTEQEQEVKEPEQSPGTKSTEKTLTQSEVNKLMAEDRRKHDQRYKDLEKEYKDFRSTIEEREKAANDAAAEKVEALRKDLPEPITKLLDRMTPVEQLEWLNDPENNIVAPKKEIPPLPHGRENGGPQRKIQTIV